MGTNMPLLCLRTTPIDHRLPSPTELLYSKVITGNWPVRIQNMEREKDKIHESLQKCQKEQRRYYNCSTSNLPNFHNSVMRQNQQTCTWERAVITGTWTEPRSYNVSTENGSTIRNWHHLYQIPHTTRMQTSSISEERTSGRCIKTSSHYKDFVQTNC